MILKGTYRNNQGFYKIIQNGRLAKFSLSSDLKGGSCFIKPNLIKEGWE